MKLYLRDFRRRAGFTQKDLADTLDVGLKTVGNWECERSAMTLEDAYRCARLLGCSVNDLCGWYVDHESSDAVIYPDIRQERINDCFDRLSDKERDTAETIVRALAAMPDETAEGPAAGAARAPRSRMAPSG